MFVDLLCARLFLPTFAIDEVAHFLLHTGNIGR